MDQNKNRRGKANKGGGNRSEAMAVVSKKMNL
jgi:hypothetical protein